MGCYESPVAVLGVAAAVVDADAEDLAGPGQEPFVADVTESDVSRVIDECPGVVDAAQLDETAEILDTVEPPPEVDDSGAIAGYNLRQADGKRKVVQAFKELNYQVLAMGDSYNDIDMPDPECLVNLRNVA